MYFPISHMEDRLLSCRALQMLGGVACSEVDQLECHASLTHSHCILHR